MTLMRRAGGIARRLVVAAALGGVVTAVPASAAELVMFTDPACPWCKAWERDIGPIYARTEEGRALPLRRVTLREARPEDTQGLADVSVTPTFVALDDDGREIGRIVGYAGDAFFWAELSGLRDALSRQGGKPGAEP